MMLIKSNNLANLANLSKKKGMSEKRMRVGMKVHKEKEESLVGREKKAEECTYFIWWWARIISGHMRDWGVNSTCGKESRERERTHIKLTNGLTPEVALRSNSMFAPNSQNINNSGTKLLHDPPQFRVVEKIKWSIQILLLIYEKRHLESNQTHIQLAVICFK